MPELPEVETVKRIIEPQVKGRSIISVEVRNPQVIAYPSSEGFIEAVCNNTIIGMNRRGKYLSFSLADGGRIILHLRMTGQLLVTPADYPEEKHTHLVMRMSDGKQIRYIDVRRFGRFWYLKSGESDAIAGMDKLGPEPTDSAISASYLKETIGGRKKTIKEMLLDQSVVAGIGNIYSDEILYAAGIYPETKCADLTDDEWRRLAEHIPAVIKWGIEANRVTPEEYLAGKGKEYRNTPFLKAYGHAGKPCAKCGTVFEKITVGGRGSTFCPRCQKAPMLSATEIYKVLLSTYGKPRWWSDDPYTVMFQAILVQNTTWASVEKVTESIGADLTPEKITNLSDEKLLDKIKSCGFGKAKSAAIRRLTEWYGRYGYDAELISKKRRNALRKELLEIKGIGAETADVLLVFAFHKASFIIDAYTRRFLSRLGFTFENDAQIRAFFESGLPENYQIYGWYHWLILDHGIQRCGKKRNCEGCPFDKCKERI